MAFMVYQGFVWVVCCIALVWKGPLALAGGILFFALLTIITKKGAGFAGELLNLLAIYLALGRGIGPAVVSAAEVGFWSTLGAYLSICAYAGVFGIGTWLFAVFFSNLPDSHGGHRPTAGSSTARRYLSVPYGDKEFAKRLGARWDGAAKSWYVPPGLTNKAADELTRRWGNY